MASGLTGSKNLAILRFEELAECLKKYDKAEYISPGTKQTMEQEIENMLAKFSTEMVKVPKEDAGRMKTAMIDNTLKWMENVRVDTVNYVNRLLAVLGYTDQRSFPNKNKMDYHCSAGSSKDEDMDTDTGTDVTYGQVPFYFCSPDEELVSKMCTSDTSKLKPAFCYYLPLGGYFCRWTNVTAGPHSGSKTTHQSRGKTSQASQGFGHLENPQPEDIPQQKMNQAQLHLLRSLQASSDMVYEGFAHVIGSLEEFERRELPQKHYGPMLNHSNLDIPSQSHKSNEDVQGILEGQLLAFQINANGCPEEAAKIARKELADETLKWIAHRQDQRIPIGKTDEYATKLYEILTMGKTKHATPKERPKMNESQLKDVLRAYMYGEHKRGEIDQKFRDQPDRKAEKRIIRGGSSFRAGAVRMHHLRPDLVPDFYDNK